MTNFQSICHSTPEWPSEYFGSFARAVRRPANSGRSFASLAVRPRECATVLNAEPAAPAETGDAHIHPTGKDHLCRPRRRRVPPGFLTMLQYAELGEFAPSTGYARVARGEVAASKWHGIIVIAEAEARRSLEVQPLHTAGAADPEVRHD